MNAERVSQLISVYRDGLLDDTLPFWINHGIERAFSGVRLGFRLSETLGPERLADGDVGPAVPAGTTVTFLGMGSTLDT